MRDSDKNRFKELISLITETYKTEFTLAGLKLWWSVFQPYSLKQFEAALFAHIACPDNGMYSPKPANLMKFIVGSTAQLEQRSGDTAEHSWAVIVGEIRRIGSYGTLELENRQAMAAVKAIGGWKKLCLMNEKELVWAHKEFTAIYKNYDRTPLEYLPKNLPGIIELENHKISQQGGARSLHQVFDNLIIGSQNNKNNVVKIK